MPTYNGVEVADTRQVYQLADGEAQEELDAHPRDLADELAADAYVETMLRWKGGITADYFETAMPYAEAADHLDALVEDGVAEPAEMPVPPTGAVYILDGEEPGGEPPAPDELEAMERDEKLDALIRWKGRFDPEYLVDQHDFTLGEAIDALEQYREEGIVRREEKPMDTGRGGI